jgi:hypothetical protein
VYVHVPAASAVKVKGPGPFAGATVTIPVQFVVLSVKTLVLGCVGDTLCVGVPLPAARNESDAGARLIAGVAVGAAVAVGDADGELVGAVVGEIAPTVGDELDEPPPPQATRATAVTPAATMNERKRKASQRAQAHRCVP